MHSLLNPQGILTGVMFSQPFEKEGPPFGGTQEEYEGLFTGRFILNFSASEHSIPARQGHELKAVLTKR